MRAFLVSLLFFFIISCSSSGNQVCEPGRQLECTCAGGEKGFQKCVEDGSKWGECECASVVVPYLFSAARYNDLIIVLQNRIIKGMIDFSKSFDNEDKSSMDRKHAELLATIDGVLKDAKKIVPFKDSTEFRDAAMEMFEFYDSIAKKEYLEIVKILKMGKPGEKDQARISEIVKSISEREKALDKKFQRVQRAFAIKHGVKLKDNRLQKQIDNL